VVDIEIEPRRRARRKRRRTRADSGIADGAAPGRSQRRRRESAAWKAGDWGAGDDYAVEAILDRKPATATDVLNYANTEGAEVSVGSDMFWVKWEGWGSEYNSWEPRSFIIDEQLISAYESSTAGGSSRPGWPAVVHEVRRRRLGNRGRARLEARCSWPDESENEASWVRATQSQIGARAMALARELDKDAERRSRDCSSQEARASTARVTTRQRGKERERPAGVDGDEDGPRPSQRRRPLAVIAEDSTTDSDDET
jgi:hypothetical protein